MIELNSFLKKKLSLNWCFQFDWVPLIAEGYVAVNASVAVPFVANVAIAVAIGTFLVRSAIKYFTKLKKLQNDE